MNELQLSALLSDLRRFVAANPLPWRVSEIGVQCSANGRAVDEMAAVELLAEYLYDIVPLVEQCAEHGSPEEIAANAADEIADVEKSADEKEAEMQQEIDDLEADIRRLEKEADALERENEGLQETIDDLQAALDALVAAGVVERLP